MPWGLCVIRKHMGGCARFREIMDQIWEVKFSAKSSQGWGLLEGWPWTAALVSTIGAYRRDPGPASGISGKSWQRGQACHFEKFFKLVLTNSKFGPAQPLWARQLYHTFFHLSRVFLWKFFEKFYERKCKKTLSRCKLWKFLWKYFQKNVKKRKEITLLLKSKPFFFHKFSQCFHYQPIVSKLLKLFDLKVLSSMKYFHTFQ